VTAPPREADFQLIEELSRDLVLSLRDIGDLLAIHPRTLQRRRESGKLEEAELLKAEMLDEAFALAVATFHDSEMARSWLFSPLAELEFERPVDLLKTIKGYERVKGLLGQIMFGVY
jgi:putative toxin-antitoxin system antitoxin component (TIGR02293 family)